jgi:hypothetical protein
MRDATAKEKELHEFHELTRINTNFFIINYFFVKFGSIRPKGLSHGRNSWMNAISTYLLIRV